MTTSHFPNEIWLSIFQCLDYCSLKRCERVNKGFRALTRDSTLDSILFRSSKIAPRECKHVTQYKFHPAFIHVQCGVLGTESAIHLINAKLHMQSLSSTNTASELATYPQVSCLVVAVKETLTTVRNTSGVTLHDVFTAICQKLLLNEHCELCVDKDKSLGSITSISAVVLNLTKEPVGASAKWDLVRNSPDFAALNHEAPTGNITFTEPPPFDDDDEYDDYDYDDDAEDDSNLRIWEQNCNGWNQDWDY